jgi:hypothetical protein
MTTAQRTGNDGPAGEFRKIPKPVKTQKMLATDAWRLAAVFTVQNSELHLCSLHM